MFSRIDVVTPPLDEPVTLSQLKAKARIDSHDDDAILHRLIVSAREECERFTRRSLITQTLDVWYDSWTGPGVIDDLPRGNVQSITEIAMYDDAGLATLAEQAIYAVSGNVVIFNTFPPYFRSHLGVRVRIVSGYGDDPEDVPMPLREGILEYATHLYDHPGGEGQEAQYAAQATGSGIPPGVLAKWRPYQIRVV